MSIRQLARADHAAILSDAAGGLGWPTQITDPAAGTVGTVVGLVNDVWETLDPDTGAPVRSQAVSVVLPLSGLEAAGLGVPQYDSRQQPWLVEFVVANKLYTYAVREVREDRTLGNVTCLLEEYSA